MPVSTTIRWMLRTAFLACACLCASGFMKTAGAHMVSAFNIRVVHFDYVSGGMLAYFRLSLPLVIGERPAPYIVERLESGHFFYYADPARIRGDTAGLGHLIAEGHRIVAGGNLIQPRVLAVRARAKGSVPPFNSLAQARAAVDGPSLPQDAADIEAAHVLIDAALFYPSIGRAQQFALSSTLGPGRYGNAETRNMMFSHLGDTAVHYTASGLLTQPVHINPPLTEAIRQFVLAGGAHILAGWDHLLFIVCLVIGDMRLRSIALRITGFSLGHSLSLLAGFYGIVPDANWFPPAVEVTIALSVLAASVTLLLPGRAGGMSASIAALAGLAHGFGFALGLRDMLADTGPNVAGSLISFNIGVEIGQLMVAASIWAALYLLVARQAAWAGIVRKSIAVASTLVSFAWLLYRIPPVLAVV